MRFLLLTLLILSYITVGWSQPLPQPSDLSVQLEAGLAYQEEFSEPENLENNESNYQPAALFMVRGNYLFSDTIGAFAAAGYHDGARLEAGLVFPFTPNPSDPFGWHTSMSAGLSYQTGNKNAFGLLISAQVHYNVTDDLFIGLRYDHRPILRPRWSQAFNISLVTGWYIP